MFGSGVNRSAGALGVLIMCHLGVVEEDPTLSVSCLGFSDENSTQTLVWFVAVCGFSVPTSLLEHLNCNICGSSSTLIT